MHGKDADPFFAEDLEAAHALVDSTDEVKLFLYPGDEHLFADSSLILMKQLMSDLEIQVKSQRTVVRMRKDLSVSAAHA